MLYSFCFRVIDVETGEILLDSKPYISSVDDIIPKLNIYRKFYLNNLNRGKLLTFEIITNRFKPLSSLDLF